MFLFAYDGSVNGDWASHDARLVETEDLLVNNAPLTGESRSQPLKSGPAKGRLIESPNIAFAGCSVLRGNGTAVVFATGHRTELGKIAALSRDVRRPLSPLQRETNRMARVLTAIAAIMGILFFAYGVASGRSLWVNIVFMLGIIVANVPEGLLPTFTLALSMARKQVLVKNLEAVEALGAVHVICTDKTGTLTRNELAIAALLDPLRGEPISDQAALRSLLKAALVASEVRPATINPGSSPGWSGDPMGDPLLSAGTEALADGAGRLGDLCPRLGGLPLLFGMDLVRKRLAARAGTADRVRIATVEPPEISE
jgi:sodium/potassium-transporting ATPase subunit alpha